MPVRVYDWKNKVFFLLRAATTADPTDLFTREDIASISPPNKDPQIGAQQMTAKENNI